MCETFTRIIMYIQNISYLPKVNNVNKERSLKNNNSTTARSVNTYITDMKAYNAFYYPVNFTSSKERTFSSDNRKLKEKTGDFQVLRFNNIPCPACGKKMANWNLYEQLERELSELEPEQYLECLGKYTEYMRPVEESVYNELVELSKIPGNSKDIRTLLEQMRDKKLPILQEAQMRVIKKMRSLARTLPNKQNGETKSEREILENQISNLVQLIRKTNAEAPFRRKIALEKIKNVQIKNPYKYEKLQNIAKTFPTSSDMNSAWIVKYSGKNKYNEDWKSYDIALRFLSSSVANTDHIVAYKIENNHDDISNYMAMHNACNSQKGCKYFIDWLNEDRENRIRYMQEYFDAVDGIIKRRKIKKKKYRHYVEYATETIARETDGQVKISCDTNPLT